MMEERTEYPAAGEKAAWEAVLASLCHWQGVIPDAVLPDLRQGFDRILTELESVAGWETARIKRPVVILGSLDGVETGVRQLRRAVPLETTVMQVGGVGVILPTLPEVLRIKAFLCLDRNATRDYLDLAALAAQMGIESAVEALWRMDEYYPQKNDDQWAVRTQLVMQLAAPLPYDLETVDLAEYKGVRPPFDQWSHVADVCGQLSDRLLEFCVRALQAEASPASRDAQTRIDNWRTARARGQTIPPVKLPGLKA